MREQKNSHLGMIGWAMFLTGALSLGSCSSDDTIDAIQGEAITFGNAFVENSTRATDPSYGAEANAFTQFQVWGRVTGNTTGNTVNLYGGDGAKVTGSVGAEWSCNETEYWIPSATYKFIAIANAGSVSLTNGLPATISYTADIAETPAPDGTKDLLLGELNEANSLKTVTTDNNATPSESPVAFTFTHLLSKVVFTFTNIDNKDLTVSDIQITGFTKEGTYNIAGKKWTSAIEDENMAGALKFGSSIVKPNIPNTSAYERLVIPGTYTLNISISIDGRDEPITAELSQEFLANNSYNFTADIDTGKKYIIFTITSTNWDSSGSEPEIQG